MNNQYTTHFLKRKFTHFNLFNRKSKISSFNKKICLYLLLEVFLKKDILIQPVDVMDGESLKLFYNNFSLKRNTKVIHVS